MDCITQFGTIVQASLLGSAPDDELVIRSKHVEEEKIVE